jgi:hypothetical protein
MEQCVFGRFVTSLDITKFDVIVANVRDFECY